MPNSRVGLPRDSWVSSVRRGIIPESALCALCRYRHKTHWTGHKTRLNRDLSGRFGSGSYAQEELRAELASAFIGATMGLPADIPQHASYIGNWIKALKEDKREIFRAAADAQKITDLALSFHPAYAAAMKAEIEQAADLSSLPRPGVPHAESRPG